jgi:polyamine oxidase
MINLTGIDTSKALLEEIRNERKIENQNHLLEPLLALTGSLTLTKTDAVSNLHKCDIPTQLYLSGKLSIPEAIL